LHSLGLLLLQGHCPELLRLQMLLLLLLLVVMLRLGLPLEHAETRR
jgi:hypothetical protein